MMMETARIKWILHLLILLLGLDGIFSVFSSKIRSHQNGQGTQINHNYCYIMTIDNHRCEKSSRLTQYSRIRTAEDCAKKCNQNQACDVFSFKHHSQDCETHTRCTKTHVDLEWKTYDLSRLSASPCYESDASTKYVWERDIRQPVYVKKIVFKEKISDNGAVELRVGMDPDGRNNELCGRIERGSSMGICANATKGRYILLRPVENATLTITECAEIYYNQNGNEISAENLKFRNFSSVSTLINGLESKFAAVQYRNQYLCGSAFEIEEIASHLCEQRGFVGGSQPPERKLFPKFPENFHSNATRANTTCFYTALGPLCWDTNYEDPEFTKPILEQSVVNRYQTENEVRCITLFAQEQLCVPEWTPYEFTTETNMRRGVCLELFRLYLCRSNKSTRSPPLKISRECGLNFVEDRSCQHNPYSLACIPNGEKINFMTCESAKDSGDVCRKTNNSSRALDMFIGKYPICSDESIDKAENDEVATILCNQNGFPYGEFAEGQVLTSSSFKMRKLSCRSGAKMISECNYELESRYRKYVTCKSLKTLRAQCFSCDEKYILQIMINFDNKYFPESAMPDMSEIRQAASETLKELIINCGDRKRYDLASSKTYWLARNLLDRLAKYSPPQPADASKKIIRTQSSHAARFVALQVETGFASTFHRLKDLWTEATFSRTKLSNYFGALADFDREKAKEDRLYIESVIERNNKQIMEALGRIESMLRNVLSKSELFVSLDVAGKTIALASAAAKSVNPLGWISGATDPNDVLDRSKDLAQSLAKVPELFTLESRLETFSNLLPIFTGGAQANKELQDQFLALIDTKYHGKDEDLSSVAKQFTSSYGSFTPAITKDLIANFTTTLSVIIEGACAIIFSGASLTASAVQGTVAYTGECGDLTIQVGVLEARLEEAYDKQFELMDAGAELARSIIAAEGAKRLKQNLKSLSPEDRVKEDLFIRWKVLIVSYEHHVEVIRAACDSIEYKSGGSLPDFCKSPLTASSDSLQKLREYDFNRKICKSTLHPRKAYLPAMSNPSPKDVMSGVINLTELYVYGETLLKIPNKNYLIENQWIAASESQSSNAYYIRQLQLFLPVPAGSYVVELSFQHDNDVNQFSPESRKKYVLASALAFKTQYEVGGGTCFGTWRTPYQVPSCPEPRSVCELGSGALENEEYLPTVYGSWRIRLANVNTYGLKRLPIPKIVGKMHLQAVVDVCASEVLDGDKASLPESDYVTTFISESDVNYCCIDRGMRWSVFLGACEKCPSGGKPSYDSYYCEEGKFIGPKSNPNAVQDHKAKRLLCKFLRYTHPTLFRTWCHKILKRLKPEGN